MLFDRFGLAAVYCVLIVVFAFDFAFMLFVIVGWLLCLYVLSLLIGV